MKRFYKLFACWVSVLLLVFSSGMRSHASLESLLISTDSNALMTMELDDSDYSVMPMSTLGTVTNTVNKSSLSVLLRYKHKETGSIYVQGREATFSDGRFRFSNMGPDNYYLYQMEIYLTSTGIPSPGTYDISFDFASDFAFNWSDGGLWFRKEYTNAASSSGTIRFGSNFSQFSGDIYVSPFTFNLSNVSALNIFFDCNDLDANDVAGNFAVRFVRVDSDPSAPSTGNDTSSADYQSDVSSSLSDLSSSVDTMTDEISGVTEAIQNLQGAMEPHYSNVLTQLHHITEQLHAFYDQVYNNIHLPELDMLTQIKTAIENIDLQIEVDISEVKTAINNMSTAVQNKLQATTDQITGGYDNSGMSSDKSELDGVLDQYEQAEEQLFDDAKGHINDFEFNTPLDSFTGPLADVSYFLNGMFEAMGPMNVVISFSLTLTIAMVMIGWYRFKGGR